MATRALPSLAGALVMLLKASLGAAQSFVVSPYLQDASPIDVWVSWETSRGSDSKVEWGATRQLGRISTGNASATHGMSRLHEVELKGLSPDTRYYYRVRTGSLESDVSSFRTPPSPGTATTFRMLALSDMQRDDKLPGEFHDLVADGVLALVADEYRTSVEDAFALVLLPGDLVADGRRYRHFHEELFAPLAELARHVPLYPVLGNHEHDSAHYFRYFHLPENGGPHAREHYWFTDYVNVRIIGLDSNEGHRSDEQLSFLEHALADACRAPHLDFVITELHHPEHSELWPRGNTAYAGLVARRLEHFSSACAKPSVALFGHTHGYARGHSRDHPYTMVNVASAGGDLDYAGEHEQVDDPEYVVSQDEYGFVIIDVRSGRDPELTIRRISRGNPGLPRDNEERDRVTIRRDNRAPLRPRARFPLASSFVDPRSVELVVSPFADPEGDLHGATHFQLTDASCDFARPRIDRWFQHKNSFGGLDTQRGADLTRLTVGPLPANAQFCYRVRMRDQSLAWSDWSAPQRFRTSQNREVATDRAASTHDLDPASCRTRGNLLQNGSAEEGTSGFTQASRVESIASGACNTVPSYDGARFFAVGGVCAHERSKASVSQRVPLVELAPWIAAGRARARFGGALRNYAGDDRPSMELVWRDQGGRELRRSARLHAEKPVWTQVDAALAVPRDARYADVVLHGERERGTDNDSYFDGLYLLLDCR